LLLEPELVFTTYDTFPNNIPEIAYLKVVFSILCQPGCRASLINLKIKAMSLDVLEAAKRLLPDSIITKAAMSLGETEANIRKALKGAIPAVLAGLLHRSARNDESSITDLLKNVNNIGVINVIPNLFEGKADPNASAVSSSSGANAMISDWLKSVFGSKLINIINAVSIYADVKSSSANAILNLAVSVALGPIAQYTADNNLGKAEINALLQSQKSAIINAIPAGFNLSGSMGINSLNDIGTKIVTVEPKPYENQRIVVKNGRGKWIWPVILVATFGGLIWFFSRRSDTETETTLTPPDTTRLVMTPTIDTPALVQVPGKLDSTSGNYIYDPGVEIEIQLPDSTLLKVGANSTEARLFNMLTDTTWSIDTIDKTKNWVTLDRVYFETGKAMLAKGSDTQVRNIASMLKNFPASSIKIGGYTDNEGDSIVNKRLSDQRAKKVMNELVKFGVRPKQISEAVGYGPEYPVCPANDSPDCKARNRRVDLKVAAK